VIDEPIRVVIADDHPAFRSGLRFMLTAADNIEVTAEAASGTQALAVVHAEQPDVVVMDLNMPELGGIEATRRIVADSPHVAVLVLTMLEDDESVFAAMRAGARGYLLKGAGEDDIERAVRGVAGGEAIFGPAIAERIIAYFTAGTAIRPAAAPFPQLSERETEVLSMVADGKTNPEIARTLFLSPKTVRNHVSNIFTKLHVADRAHAIAQARNAGLGTPIDAWPRPDGSQ
jgi:DNA-binding NarL/FixJ family response regulator